MSRRSAAKQRKQRGLDVSDVNAKKDVYAHKAQESRDRSKSNARAFTSGGPVRTITADGEIIVTPGRAAGELAPRKRRTPP